MIRSEPSPAALRRPSINPLRGEFEVPIDGALCRFDTRLSTIAAIEGACGDRAIVEILNGIILRRKARDVLPLIAAALAACDPTRPDADSLAERATMTEAEAFVLALIFALGFKVGRDGEGGGGAPLAGTTSGGAGASSRSAA